VIAIEGLCVPAHVDRPSFSILNNLGFIPPELPIAGIEVSRHALISTKFVPESIKTTKTEHTTLYKEHFSPQQIVQSVQPDARSSLLTTSGKLVELLAGLCQYGVLINSDAHRLSEMGARTQVRVAAPTSRELGLALRGQQGRHIDLVLSQE
jgi:hypothetical protein